MLQSTLTIVRQKLQSSELISKEKIDLLIPLLKLYKNDSIIYPGTIIAKVGIPPEKAYEILDMIKDLNFLETNYEIYCHQCSRFRGRIFRSFNSIPKELICDECNNALSVLDDTIVVYRVINNGDR